MELHSSAESLTLEQAVGRVLRLLRKEKQLFQVDVAAATNFAVRSIGKMEHGSQSMTLRSLDALSDFYGVPLEEIIRRAKEMRYDRAADHSEPRSDGTIVPSHYRLSRED